jgi:uncharacterized Zn finger protein
MEESQALPFRDYVSIGSLDTLVRCNRCGSVVEGNIVARSKHDQFHIELAATSTNARRAESRTGLIN